MDEVLGVIIFAPATSATPGPNVLMVAAGAAQVGVRRLASVARMEDRDRLRPFNG